MINIFEEKENIALRKMYPMEDIKEKYIVIIYAEHTAKQSESVVSSCVSMGYSIPQPISEPLDYQINYGRKNKDMVYLGKVKNGEVSKIGIPLLFNDYEDLQKLKHIEIQWILKQGEETTGYICRHDFNFELSEDIAKRRYGLKISTSTFDDERTERMFVERYKITYENKKEVKREVLDGCESAIQPTFMMERVSNQCKIKGYRVRTYLKPNTYAADIHL